MQEERELLSRQQDAMRESAGPRELCTYSRTPSMKMRISYTTRQENIWKSVYSACSEPLIVDF